MSDTLDDARRLKPVTMKDVANLAGVSMATVSRVLNNSSKVDAEMTENVQAAISQLKYQPNRVARTLAGSRSTLLGLLVTDLQNPFFMELMRGVEEVAQKHGYLLIIGNTMENVHREEQYLEILAAESVAGAIVVPTQEQAHSLDILKIRNIPIVTVDRRIQDSSIDTVLIDNVAAAHEATTHLLATGHRRIGIITGPSSTMTANERLSGYEQALQEAGIAPALELQQRGPYREESGEQLTHQLLTVDPPIDALLTANNQLTIGALRALYTQQKRIPEDIAIVGFDEVGWTTSHLITITTVTQPAYELGRIATERLFHHIKYPDAPAQEIILKYQLIVRESSAPSNP
ncbi:LacI family DNA-binding transcriptional regulator [Dictyobacter arantiisoli]|uniref:LacI family transcriptional regulator n=1 Tax=Dictyobacter arantiisoli TaxID=2014874 RepID=A0A5A5TC08_9CHLR|nr:LacI family DNA-binding transcriptional regulator [Dictyobacter arantiisoli]GCF08464.1 LacI family transcriptional regulator [Dictyobacter arantiisoli]